MTRTEKQKMIDGDMYSPFDKELEQGRKKARKLFNKYNKTPKKEILEELFNQSINKIMIEPPFHCDYGCNIDVGENVYMNFNCTILDCAKVKIGSNCLFGPNVQLYTPLHPLDVKTRALEIEYAKPITIGANCWFGGGVIVLAGVEIGDNCVIGAGSVVTKSIPKNSLAVGNPCKVIRKIKND